MNEDPKKRPPRPFQFSEFTVRQNHCAMKVGTDAVLLGAWAAANAPSRILDLGTGTGVIALMLAQRFSDADVVAVDINDMAVDLAKENFQNSPWTDRCTAHHDSVQEFSQGTFDLIVSNPPWFQNSLLPDSKTRRTARHDDSLPYEDLVQAAARMLNGDGRLSVVIPFEDRELFTTLAGKENLFPRRRAAVRPTPNHPPKRMLLEFGLEFTGVCEESEFAVEVRRHEYTPEYAELTQDFLLRARQFVK